MKIAIYTRKSVYIQGSISIETQIEMCKDYAYKKYDNPQFEILEDEGFSGGNINRPAFQKLLKMSKLKQIDVVMCYKVDRIARNTLDFLNTLELFNQNNVTLISISEGFDPNTQIGKMMLTLLASFAEMERSNTQQRVKDNMLRLAKKGKWTGGSPPLGFAIAPEGGLTWVNKDLIKDTFTLKYESYKNNDIINKIKGLYNHEFQGTTLVKTLKRPLYVKSNVTISNFLKLTGYEVIGNEDNIHGYLTYNDNNKKIATVSDVEGIIEPNTWLKVNEAITNKNTRGTNKYNKHFWLTKTLVCSACGKTYLGSARTWNNKYKCKNGDIHTYSSVYNYYMCRDMGRGSLKTCTNNKRVKKEHLEDKVAKYIYVLKNKKTFDEVFANTDNNNTNAINKLNKELKTKEKIINNLVDKLALVDTVASELIIDKINEASKQIEKLRNKIATFELEDMNTTNKSDIYSNIINFNNEMTVDEKRRCVMNIFEKIVYNHNQDSFDVFFIK